MKTVKVVTGIIVVAVIIFAVILIDHTETEIPLGGDVKFAVEIGGSPIELDRLGVWEKAEGKLVPVTGFTCSHNMTNNIIKVTSDCSKINPGTKPGCEVITVDYNGARTTFEVYNYESIHKHIKEKRERFECKYD